MNPNIKFFVVETEVAKGQRASAITEKATHDEAKMLYHQILASAYANKDVTYALVMIIDENGMNYEREVIRKAVESTEA